MAVFPDTTSPGGSSSTPLGTLVSDDCEWTINGGDIGILVGMSFSASDLRIGPIQLNDNSLNNLDRQVTYRGVELVSLGVQQWGTLQAWTEVFGAVGIPPGPGTLYGHVYGGGASQRWMRFAGQSWTGVDAFGAPVLLGGSGTSMAISATVSAAGRLAGIFGSRSGLAGFSTSGASTQYLQNTGIGLMIGDVAGTGSTQALTGIRQQSGPWGGVVVPLQVADTVASCDLLLTETLDLREVVRRRARPGVVPRQVFTVSTSTD
jgi:hypothetical protein